MEALSPWRHLENLAGVPVRFVIGEGGVARTYAALAHARRCGIDVRAAQVVVIDALNAAFGFDAGAIAGAPDGAVAVALDRDEWLEHLSDSASGLSEAARAVGDASSCVDTDGVTRTGWEAATIVGADALTWSFLRSSSRRPPFRLEPSLALLAGRTDANPLSLVRRAHARAAGSLEPVDTIRISSGQGCSAPPSPAVTARRLRAALFVHDSAGVPDAGTRPAETLRALETVAGETLSHVERTPASRTDVPALQVARRVLQDALRALGLDAPTPY